MAKSPSKRVRKALTKYVRSQVKNPRIKLPANWTSGQFRVDKSGNVQIRVNPSRCGSGRLVKNVKSVKAARIQK